MNQKQKLQAERAKQLAAMKTLNETAADGIFNAEQQASYDAAKARVADLDSAIARAAELMELERSAATMEATTDEARPEGQRSNIQVLAPEKFKKLGQQMIAVRNYALSNGRNFDNRLAPLAAPQGASEGVGADGGFLIQQDFGELLLNQAYDTGAILSRCRQIPISSNSIKIPIIDEASRAIGSQYGGVIAYWESEAGTPTASKPKFGRLELSAKKLMGVMYATDELLADAAALGTIAEQAFADVITFKLEDSIINGDGAGKPLGILNASALEVVTKETSQPANTVLQMNVSKMWAKMPPRLRAEAVWLAHSDVEPQLDSMVVPVKNVAGSDNVGGSVVGSAVYAPGGTFMNPGAPRLKGAPVLFTEYNPALSTQGDLLLVNLKQYLTVQKGALEMAQSMHVAFLTAEECFRWVLRTDGQPAWKQSVTPAKGSNKISPFIALGAR